MLRPVLLPIFLSDLEEKATIYISKVISDLELYQAVGCRVRGSGSGEIPLHRYAVFKPSIAIGYLLFREVIWCQGESLDLTARI